MKTKMTNGWRVVDSTTFKTIIETKDYSIALYYQLAVGRSLR